MIIILDQRVGKKALFSFIFFFWLLVAKWPTSQSAKDIYKMSYQDKQDILQRHLADVEKIS